MNFLGIGADFDEAIEVELCSGEDEGEAIEDEGLCDVFDARIAFK